MGLGSFFIIAMTLVSARGVAVSERMQIVLIAVQFGVLIIASIWALTRVFSDTAGAQATSPQLAWLWPSGLDVSSVAAAIILCVFIYWGWDACLAVGEETKNPGKTPGIAAVITTLILVCTYVLVAYAVQSFAGFSVVGIGLNNPDNTDDVLTVLGDPVGGPALAVAARALPDSPDIESLVAEGMTLESALKKLNWDESDILVVGSSRFAAPKRIFLGSTASRILAGVDVPVIVIPPNE